MLDVERMDVVEGTVSLIFSSSSFSLSSICFCRSRRVASSIPTDSRLPVVNCRNLERKLWVKAGRKCGLSCLNVLIIFSPIFFWGVTSLFSFSSCSTSFSKMWIFLIYSAKIFVFFSCDIPQTWVTYQDRIFSFYLVAYWFRLVVGEVFL